MGLVPLRAAGPLKLPGSFRWSPLPLPVEGCPGGAKFPAPHYAFLWEAVVTGSELKGARRALGPGAESQPVPGRGSLGQR